MGTKPYSEFKSDLTLELQNRDDISDKVGNWINEAYLTLTTKNRFWGLKRDFRFPQLMTQTTATTADGTPYVSTPTDALIVYSVYDNSSDSKLDKVTDRKYIGYTGRAVEGSRSAPSKWTRMTDSGGTDRIYLNPTPDAAYGLTIFYRKRPAVLSADADVTVIGAEWDYPIVKLAVIQSLMRFKQYEYAKLEKEEWVEMVSGLIGIYDKEDLDSKDTWAIDPRITRDMDIKITTRHKVQQFRNPMLYEWYQSLPENDREVAVRTVDYIKINYPEFRDILLGELIWIESEED